MTGREGLETGCRIENGIPNTKKIDDFSKEFRKYDTHYNDFDTGPFQVVLESKEGNLGKIHPMKLGRILKTNFDQIKQNIKNIAYAGQNKLRLEFDSAKSANIFINSDWLKSSNFKYFIPNHI